MGLLIDIVHEVRVRDPAHAARLFRALGCSTVHVDGFTPTTPRELDDFLDAAVAGQDSQITFERATLDAAAFTALADLACAIEGYLDANTRRASLRVWPYPRPCWIHGYRRIPDDEVAALLGASLAAPLRSGRTTITAAPSPVAFVAPDAEPIAPDLGPDDVLFKISKTAFVPFDIETKRPDLAFALFHAIVTSSSAETAETAEQAPNTDPLELTRGWVSVCSGRTREPLRRFLHALPSASFSGHLVLAPAVAADLATRIPGELEWDGGPIRVSFPEGTITTYILAPVPPDEEQAWRDRISRALGEAG